MTYHEFDCVPLVMFGFNRPAFSRGEVRPIRKVRSGNCSWRRKMPILAFDGKANNFWNGEATLLAKDGDYAPLVERLAKGPDLCCRIADNAGRGITVYSWAEMAG